MRILDATRNPSAPGVLLSSRRAERPDVHERVRTILDAVRAGGDQALLRFTREHDCPRIEEVGLRVPDDEIRKSYDRVGKKFLRALRLACANVKRFHKGQRPESRVLSKKGMVLEQRYLPLGRVGIYVPGGKASYPSTVIMNAVPAEIAGVREVVMVTPPGADGSIPPEVLVAAGECGITEMYRVGGAQAVAALAYGTESIRRVDKITGPGNAYVAAAKRMVFGDVGIDSLAGPTELVILADETADPAFLAADMIAQAEHDEAALAILITTSSAIAQGVEREVELQLGGLPRATIARQSLETNGAIILVASLREAVDLANSIAPEHLEILVKRAERIVERMTAAGAIFVGQWSPEALGDYVAGPNHTLPTGGSARFSSALSVTDFMRFTSIIEVGKRRFAKLAPHVEILAAQEGLHGHAASVRVRKAKV
jgi:histidinol dehydrogenase